MHLFYAPDIKDKQYVLNPEDSRHCTKVLRLREQDEVSLTDGKGHFYHCTITKADSRATEVKVDEKEEVEKHWPFHLQIAMAPTKNMNRTEWMLEKVTELGVDKITPLHCFHSERKIVKPARMERIITAAVKQSLKAWYPELEEMADFSDFVQKDFSGQKYIAYIDEKYDLHMSEDYEQGMDAVVLIGPEGDFSKEEVQMAVKHGFKPVSLGKSRLRTETAAVIACHSLHLLNEKKKILK